MKIIKVLRVKGVTCDNWLGVIRSHETYGNMCAIVEVHIDSRYSLIWSGNELSF